MNKETLESCLTSEKVFVKFYRRKKGNSTIDNPKHVANGGMLDTATKVLVVPQLRNGQLKNILTDDEKEYLESIMTIEEGTLSIYNKKYWNIKTVTLRKEDNIFDLSNPDQFIDYKILVANSDIVAPSLDVISHKETYSFYVEKEGDEEKRKVKSLSTKQKAYKAYGKYEDDKDILKYILRTLGKPTAKNSKIATLQGWIDTEIDNNAIKFVEIATDPLIKSKVFLNKCIDAGIVILRDQGIFDSDTGKPLAESGDNPTILNASKFINLPRQQEYKLALDARLKNSIE